MFGGFPFVSSTTSMIIPSALSDTVGVGDYMVYGMFTCLQLFSTNANILCSINYYYEISKYIYIMFSNHSVECHCMDLTKE